MKYFDKKYDNINDFEDLILYKVSRDINIEFFNSSKVKNTTSFENNIIINTSAFSNSIGGLIVLGIKAVRKKAHDIDYITDKNITKKYIENLLSFNIKPSIESIEVCEYKTENGSLFAIKIPRSKLAPHISSDYRYYSRQSDKTVLMPEHEIRNLFSKNIKPELDFVGVVNTGGVPTLSDGKADRMNFFPKFLIKNSGGAIERFYKLEIAIPSALHDISFSVLHDYFSRYDEDMIIFSIKGKSPLFQNEIFTIAEAKLTVDSSNYHVFENSSIEIKLFYSQGSKSSLIDLKNTFLYNRRLVELAQFTPQLDK